MGRQIIKQPDGKYCVFSSVVEDFIYWDATPEEIIEMEVAEARETIAQRVTAIIEKLKEGRKPYYQFTMDLKEALDREMIPEDSEAKKVFKERGWVS